MASLTNFVSCHFLTWICTLFTVVSSEICSYLTYDFSHDDRRWERMVSFKRCQWGCCWKFEDPCCTAPVGLIVGCVVGGILLLSVVTLGACCCCMCRRSVSRNRPVSGGGRLRSLGNQGPRVNIACSRERTLDATIDSASLKPGAYYYGPPPSYDEVVGAEVNPAFKPDNVQ